MHRTQLVYLCGPVSFMKVGEATSWRDVAAGVLENPDQDGIVRYQTLNPMRGKGWLRGVGEITPHTSVVEDQHIFKTCRYDVSRCDVVLANLTDGVHTRKPSIGSIFEIAWGNEDGKFVLVVSTPDNPHHHPFVDKAASLVVPTLDQALDFLTGVLNKTGVGVIP